MTSGPSKKETERVNHVDAKDTQAGLASPYEVRVPYPGLKAEPSMLIDLEMMIVPNEQIARPR